MIARMDSHKARGQWRSAHGSKHRLIQSYSSGPYLHKAIPGLKAFNFPADHADFLFFFSKRCHRNPRHKSHFQAFSNSSTHFCSVYYLIGHGISGFPVTE